MSEPRVYIHEFIDIIGQQRANYMHHMTANWVPIGLAERNQRCFGVWAVVGSTGRWPAVVNLWEYDDWAALGNNFAVEQRGRGLQDPSLERWWAEAASFRSGGLDRIVVAAPWSPSVADHEARFTTPPAGYAHELYRTRPGHDGALLDSIRDTAIAAYGEAGLALVGAFRRAMGNDDEVIVIWSFDSWDRWATFEAAQAPAATQPNAVSAWRSNVRPIVASCERILMADAPLCPLRIGRQPNEGDQIA